VSPFNEAKYRRFLEGLEVSEIMLSYARKNNEVFRFDSNYFQKKYLIEEETIRSKKFSTLKRLKIDIKSFGAYSLNNDVQYLNEGIPFIRGVNMKKGRISFNDMIYIDATANSLLWKSEIKPEMVLLSMSGTIGDVAIASKTWNYPINSNQDIAKIDTKGNINPYFLYAFLLSKFGQNYLRREARGSVQQHVFLSQIELFEIPIFPKSLTDKIQSIVELSDEKINQSTDLYTKAETILLESVGLTKYTSSKESVNIKSIKDSFLSSGRLDAEYYQKKYEQYESLILSQKNTLIKDEYLHIKTQSKKEKAGYNYIEIGDINVADGTNKSNYILIEDLPANAKIIVQKGDILISNVRPYRGAVSIINSDEKDLIVSGAFTVLRKNKKSIFNNEVLKVILRTQIYKDWLLKFNVGTSYPVIKDEDVLNLPIPFIEETMQIQIAELVEESFRLKTESESLLDVAKQAVEMAIEEGEAKAMAFIKSNIS
jgi:restriction endonuclease S subunit